MQPIIVGIAGGSGSGKTTLARSVAAECEHPTSTLAFDNYYRVLSHLHPAERQQVNFDHPDSLDVECFIEDLARLRNGENVAVPVYDFTVHDRSDDIELVEAREVVVVDGILLLVFPEIRALLDLSVFVDVDDELRCARRLERDVAERGRTVEESQAQIDATVQPMHEAFVSPSKAHADLVVDGTEDPLVGAGQVLGAIQRMRSASSATTSVA